MKITIKNPAKARPLSANVRRLMTMAREAPMNPEVEKIDRRFTDRDQAYCDMQGNIFMAAIDRGVPMEVFAPLYMTSQLAGVMDHSFSVAGGMEKDDLSGLLQVPMLLKSPETIVDVVIWLNNIVSRLDKGKSANQAVVEACINATSQEQPGVVDRRRVKITDPLAIYSGCYIRASINIYPFNANGNRGIAAGLSNIQFWEDGEPLNGRVRAEDEFGVLDDDDADDFLD